MRSNPSSGYIAFISSLIIAASSAGINFALYDSVKYSALIFLLVFAIGFGVFYVLLQYFIYRKILMIYKNIYRFKAQDEKFLDLLNNPGQDPISNVRDEVLNYMQENKREISQLKEQERFRREFIGNVSHELKTPVFSIQGYIHTLLDGALEDKDVNRKFLKKAARGIDRLAEMVEELTTISDYQSGNFTLKLSKFELAELVNEVIEMVEHLAEEKNISLEYKRNAIRPIMVNADRQRIRQVLTNLMVNAIKYGKKDGFVKITGTPEGKKVLIEVADNGQGIDEQHLTRLFERFYRLDEHRNREEGGSGLGLSIVKHILEAHNEHVDVKSEKGKGSTFAFSLPKA